MRFHRVIISLESRISLERRRGARRDAFGNCGPPQVCLGSLRRGENPCEARAADAPEKNGIRVDGHARDQGPRGGVRQGRGLPRHQTGARPGWSARGAGSASAASTTGKGSASSAASATRTAPRSWSRGAGGSRGPRSSATDAHHCRQSNRHSELRPACHQSQRAELRHQGSGRSWR